MKKLAVFIILLVFFSGCVSEKREPLLQLDLEGEKYDFSGDVRETINKIPVERPGEIYDLMKSDKFIITFNGSSGADNGYFAVAAYNLVFKASKYRAHIFRPANFTTMLLDDLAYEGNETTIIWFRGPETGATENSVFHNGNMITVQGTNYNNLTMASDRLALIVLGIWKPDDLDR